MQRSENYFTPFIDVPQRRKSGVEELVDLLIERNALHSRIVSFAMAAPIFFALGFAVAARLIGHA